jgi:uncharacterized protein
MKLESILTFFIPKDRIFFTLFDRASANLVTISKKFNELLNTVAPDKRMELINQIAELEHVGDTITHDIFTELSTNFITPFDREDIHYLATSIDDIADYVHGSAKRLQLYNIDIYTLPMRQLGEVIERSAAEIHVAISNLKGMKDIVRVKEALVRINSLENQADDIFDAAIANLFIEETNAIQLMKMKEVLANMETATDKCEDVANVIETIIVKNS